MSLNTGVNSIIHLAADIDTSKFVYYQVYSGSDGVAIINGVSVTMGAGSVLDIKVSTLSGTAIYALGSPIDVRNGALRLGN
jgi:hypothetical protein